MAQFQESRESESREHNANVTRRAMMRKLSGGGLAMGLALGAAPISHISAQDQFNEEIALQQATQFLELLNGGNVDELKQFIAPDCVFHWPWPIAGTGPDYAVRVINRVRTVVPDLVVTPEQVQVAGDWVTVIATLTGTHTGAFLGIPPTGNPVSFQAIFVGRVDEQLQIAELWLQYDVVGIGSQVAGAGDLLEALLAGTASPATPTAVRPIDQMLSVPGVMAVVDYNPDGTVVDIQSNLELAREEYDQAAALAPLLMTAINFAAERYSDVSALNWAPVTWALYSAADRWTLAFAGNRVVVAETSRVDFNELYTALVGSQP